MKENTHPKYQKVLFVDSATGYRFVCGSTFQTEERDTFEGVEYPVYRAAITSASHPFFSGSKGIVDAEGRVDKFKKKYVAAQNRSLKEEQPKQEESSDVKTKKKKK